MSTTIPESTVRILPDPRPWRVVLPQAVLERTLRRLLSHPHHYGVGPLRTHPTRTGRELLIDDLNIVESIPHGGDRSPLADWCVLRVDHRAASEIAAQCQPAPHQLLVVVTVNPELRGRWDSVIWRQGNCEPIEELHFPGRRSLRLSRHPLPDLTPEEQQRDSRTIGVLGREAVSRLREMTVTLIGAGRNGSLFAQQLVSLGVRHWRLVDPDVLRVENLNAMPGIAIRDVGQPKVRALAKSLLRQRRDLRVQYLDAPVSDTGVAELLEERTDLLATCVDDEVPRLAATIIAHRTLTTHLDLGTSIRQTGTGLVMTGDARLLLPNQGCCVCVGGIDRLKDVQYDLNRPPHTLPRRLQPVWHEARAGSLVTLNAMTVGSGIQLWLDLLTGRRGTSFWQRLEWTPEQGLVGNGAEVGTREGCKWCGGRS